MVSTWAGLKVLLTLTPGKFVREASVGSGLLTPLNVVTAPDGIRFVRLPLTFMMTRSVSVQDVLAGKTPPVKVKEVSPGFPVRTPPHVPTLKVTGSANCMPVPSRVISSVKVIPVRAVLRLGLINCTLMVENAPP